jgi:pilus assembly protein CpaB
MQSGVTTQLFKTRRRALVIGGAAALLAAILLVVYLDSYRASVNAGSQPMAVLVATRTIPRGTSGTVIAEEKLYHATAVEKSQLQNLAIADPTAISGRVTSTVIYPGEQLTDNDFTTVGAAGLVSQLTGNQRAISIPVDAAHGLIGQVQAGDHVDVYVGIGEETQTAKTKLLAANVDVLVAPASGTTSDVVLRVSAQQAAQFAYASDNARIYLVLRPELGGTSTPPATVTATTLGEGA